MRKNTYANLVVTFPDKQKRGERPLIAIDGEPNLVPITFEHDGGGHFEILITKIETLDEPDPVAPATEDPK
jgi:hypothetical protein